MFAGFPLVPVLGVEALMKTENGDSCSLGVNISWLLSNVIKLCPTRGEAHALSRHASYPETGHRGLLLENIDDRSVSESTIVGSVLLAEIGYASLLAEADTVSSTHSKFIMTSWASV